MDVNETVGSEACQTGSRTSGCCCARDYRKTLLEQVIALEWEFFQAVNNVGGRADCQDRPRTFTIMRESQFAIWTDEMLLGYYGDLRTAESEGRNPMTEKYGYMMQGTHPDEFEQIRDALPPVSPEKASLVERIVAIQVAWAHAVAEAYPHFAGRGRAIDSSEDSPECTSLETYSRGELSTFSEHTLELMLEHFAAAQEAGENLQLQVDEATARCYGYASLAAADAALAEAR